MIVWGLWRQVDGRSRQEVNNECVLNENKGGRCQETRTQQVEKHVEAQAHTFTEIHFRLTEEDMDLMSSFDVSLQVGGKTITHLSC